MTGEEPAARAREALTDEEIIAMARKVSKELRGRRGDFDRFAGWLMDWMADQLEGRPAAPEAIVRAWCKGCRAATPSVPCPKCGGMTACKGCLRCPPCDGDIPEGSDG